MKLKNSQKKIIPKKLFVVIEGTTFLSLDASLEAYSTHYAVSKLFLHYILAMATFYNVTTKYGLQVVVSAHVVVRVCVTFNGSPYICNIS